MPLEGPNHQVSNVVRHSRAGDTGQARESNTSRPTLAIDEAALTQPIGERREALPYKFLSNIHGLDNVPSVLPDDIELLATTNKTPLYPF